MDEFCPEWIIAQTFFFRKGEIPRQSHFNLSSHLLDRLPKDFMALVTKLAM